MTIGPQSNEDSLECHDISESQITKLLSGTTINDLGCENNRFPAKSMTVITQSSVVYDTFLIRVRTNDAHHNSSRHFAKWGGC
jgi:hypothetical protein